MADANENPPTTPPTAPHRQSILLKTNRRSTFFQRNVQHEPPVDNPENSDEYNAHLRKEYEKLQLVNRAVELMIGDFQNALQVQSQVAQHVDETDRLLNVWSLILEKTETFKNLLEDPEWEKSQLKLEEE
ncbi:hypothetical protein G6F57_004298 [Rhizopus arrhizus]|uniref:DASH complex subunit DUO1 n=1 Tax=Rhizopus oryzae TaxID=64495 RepID=A0A9P7BTD6_RHIOR|nr:hypothetical protein G6F23_004027 [Rhizopus arrhizus]KAG1420621.1 hypothetical protein G6F58_004100 [Rhizopus delemar]KAG0766574.1 hypothetical protein G6F24_003496 [Rhizopus arrhizus]KAG0787777.1 hypothetical protein G6F21_007674 [Rhizopus arrhizus]KAG0800627.1 hypothetical protein G6F22_002044 [Rhizopus arrhizus]